MAAAAALLAAAAVLPVGQAAVPLGGATDCEKADSRLAVQAEKAPPPRYRHSLPVRESLLPGKFPCAVDTRIDRSSDSARKHHDDQND